MVEVSLIARVVALLVQAKIMQATFAWQISSDSKHWHNNLLHHENILLVQAPIGNPHPASMKYNKLETFLLYSRIVLELEVVKYSAFSDSFLITAVM